MTMEINNKQAAIMLSVVAGTVEIRKTKYEDEIPEDVLVSKVLQDDYQDLYSAYIRHFHQVAMNDDDNGHKKYLTFAFEKALADWDDVKSAREAAFEMLKLLEALVKNQEDITLCNLTELAMMAATGKSLEELHAELGEDNE